jgi:hypothetical protein
MVHARENRAPLTAPGTIDHHVADLTVTIAADVTLAAVQEQLTRAGQWLAIDGDAQRTIGDLVERNSTGPLRLGFGGWRDVLLGMQFANGSGELITAGGRTLKNVAGYDLTKFMIGQHGVFGRVVTVTARTYKRPEAVLLATFAPDVKKLNSLLTTSCRPQWALVDRDVLRCGYLGDIGAVEFFEKSLPAYSPQQVTRTSLSDDVALRSRLWTQQRSERTFRVSVPPLRIRAFVDHADITDWIADAAFGIVIGPCTDANRIGNSAKAVGGSAMIFGADGRPEILQLQPTVSALLERLKYAFDPDAKLAPLPLSTASCGEEKIA